MDLGVRIEGQAAKRGRIPRLPSGARLVADIDAWAKPAFPDVLRETRALPPAEDSAELELDLHPAAEPVRIHADDLGHVLVTASTVAPGPGYERLVRRFVERLGDELDIAWQEPGHGGPVPVEPTLDRPTVERANLALLGWALRQAQTTPRIGRPVHLWTPPGVRYEVDATLATVLGPRDDAWLERAIVDPRVAIDVWPWWADATDARYVLDRVLCLLWTEVRWRAPADDHERAVHAEVLTLLRRAYPLDPALPYPWREWAELLRLHGDDDAAARQVIERAEAVDPSTPLIGYRRRPVTIDHEGWTLTLPGSFSERRTPEEWSGTDAGRSVTIAATVTGTAAGPMSAEAFLAQVAGHLGSEVLHVEDGELAGRARIGVVDEAGVEVAVLEGYSAVRGRGAAIRVVINEPTDWEWAIGVWRSLAPATGLGGSWIAAPTPTADGAAGPGGPTTTEAPGRSRVARMRSLVSAADR